MIAVIYSCTWMFGILLTLPQLFRKPSGSFRDAGFGLPSYGVSYGEPQPCNSVQLRGQLRGTRLDPSQCHSAPLSTGITPPCTDNPFLDASQPCAEHDPTCNSYGTFTVTMHKTVAQQPSGNSSGNLSESFGLRNNYQLQVPFRQPSRTRIKCKTL